MTSSHPTQMNEDTYKTQKYIKGDAVSGSAIFFSFVVGGSGRGRNIKIKFHISKLLFFKFLTKFYYSFLAVQKRFVARSMSIRSSSSSSRPIPILRLMSICSVTDKEAKRESRSPSIMLRAAFTRSRKLFVAYR